MNAPSNPRQNCPSCDHELRRLSPQHGDGEQPLMRRYGCTREGCMWQGLLPRMAPRPKATASQRVRTEVVQAAGRVPRRFTVALAAVVLALGGVTLGVKLWNSEPEVPLIGVTQKTPG